MKRTVLVFILLVLILSAGAFALNWGEALSLAEQNSNELISAEKDLEASEWSYRKAWSTFLPQLSASAGLTETESATSAAWSKSYSYGLSATQHLFQGMEGVYGIQSAYANVEYKRASYRATHASVYYDLRVAFTDLLIAQENVKLLEEILKQRRENSRLIQLRYDSGREDKGNLMTTLAEEKEAEYQLAAAKHSQQLARLRISQLLQTEVGGVEEAEALKEAGGADLDSLVRTTPAYVMDRKQLESSELAYKASISGFLPSLSLSGSYRKTGSDWPPSTENKSWSLTLSYSFFPGGSNIANRVITSAQLDQARQDFDRSVKELRYSLEDAYLGYQDALDALAVAQVSLAASKERSEITQVKYLNGLTNYDEWNRIESAYIQAQKGLLNYKKSALLAEAQWHKSYGGWVK